MIQKSIKIWIFSLVFFICVGCGKKALDLSQRDEVLQTRLNQIIAFINSAFQLEGSVFQGSLSLETSFENQSTLLDLSGTLAFLGGDIEGNLSFSTQQSGGLLNLSQALRGQFSLRKSSSSYYFYPEQLEIIGGTGNIQLKFLQLMLHGMRGNWFQWEHDFFSSEQWFSGFSEFPQLFSGETILTGVVEDFLLQEIPELYFLTWSLERNKNADWIFKDWKWKYKWEALEFSWSFDGNRFFWAWQQEYQLPWKIELSFEKDQLFLTFTRGTTMLKLQLNRLKNAEFYFLLQLENLEKKENKFLIQWRFSRKNSTLPLQSPPNNYIPLVQYLESLNIAF